MGLISAAKGAVSGLLADQWKEYFYCDSLDTDVLMVKGQKRVDSKRSSNTKGSDNIISNGSVIAVNEGQFMIIVQQGEIVEFCGQAGEFIWDSSTEPSMLTGLTDGALKDSILGSAKIFVRRFTGGGDTLKDQRIYYVNTKEIYGNKYGTASTIPYNVSLMGQPYTVNLRCNGEYSYMIADPLLFYKKVAGNSPDKFLRSQIDSQMKSELLTALQPALLTISATGVDYTALPAKTKEIAAALQVELSEDWGQKRGIQIYSFGINSVKATEEDEAEIKKAQRAGIYSNPGLAAGRLTDSTAQAQVLAASNENAGSMMAFAGMNMATQSGGQIGQLFSQSQQAQVPPIPSAPDPNAWTCACGTSNSGKFCGSCGEAKPSQWTCSSCGASNSGKSCGQCGKPAFKGYRCDKCGYEPPAGQAPKFCPECGDVFDEKDVK